MHEATLAGPDRSSCYEATAFWERRPDQELLRLFVEERNGVAFAALVHRHGSMVLGVCRRVLGNIHDAEDAFQTAFMVLAHKASSMREPRLLSSWLHGVALRTAQHSRARDLRRSKHEREAANLSFVRNSEAGDQWNELRERLDAELQALPEKYRAPLVLCYLEGKTHTDAARLLDWPAGSISARVARGRDLLRQRLAGRDRELRACILPVLWNCAIDRPAVSSQLGHETIAAALAELPGSALAGSAIASVSRLVCARSLWNPGRTRSGSRLKFFLAVLAILALFSAVAYAVADSHSFGPNRATGAGGAESQDAAAHSCH